MKTSRVLRSGASALGRCTRPTASFTNTHASSCRGPVLAASSSQVRHSSHSPMGNPLPSDRKKVTVGTIRSLHRKQEPITVMTAHDFPSAHVADAAGMDIVLVGDSLAMVALGMEDTSEVVMEEMILHCRSVSRATKAAMTVCSSHSALPLSSSNNCSARLLPIVKHSTNST